LNNDNKFKIYIFWVSKCLNKNKFFNPLLWKTMGTACKIHILIEDNRKHKFVVPKYSVLTITIRWLWLFSYRPYIHNRVNGNAAIDGKGERNDKRLRNTDLVNQTRSLLFDKVEKQQIQIK